MPFSNNSNYKPFLNVCERKLQKKCEPDPPCPPCPPVPPTQDTDVIETEAGVVDPNTNNTILSSVTSGIPAPDNKADPFWGLVIAADTSETYTNSVWADSRGSSNVSGVFFTKQIDGTVQTETDFTNANRSIAQALHVSFDLTITQQPNSWAGFIAQFDEEGTFSWYAYVVNVTNSSIFLNITDEADNVIVTGTYFNQTRIQSQISGTRYLPSQQIPGVQNVNDQALVAKFDPYGNLQWANTSYTPSHPTTGITHGKFSYPDSDLNIITVGFFGLGGQQTETDWYGQNDTQVNLVLIDVNFYIIKYAPDGSIINILLIGVIDDNPGSIAYFTRSYVSAASDNSFTVAGLYFLPELSILYTDFSVFYTLNNNLTASSPTVFIASYAAGNSDEVGRPRWVAKIESSVSSGIELAGLVTDTNSNVTVTINFFQAGTITIYEWNGSDVVPSSQTVGNAAIGFAVIQYNFNGAVNWVTVVSQNDAIAPPQAYDTAIDTRRPDSLNNIAIGFNFYNSAIVFNPGGQVSNVISLPGNLYKSGIVLLRNDGTFNFYALQHPATVSGVTGSMTISGGVAFDRDHCMTSVVNGRGPIGFSSQNSTETEVIDTVFVSPPRSSLRPPGVLVGKYVLSLQQAQLTAAALTRSANNKTITRYDYDGSGSYVKVPHGLIFTRKNIPVTGFLFNNADSSVTISWFRNRWRIVNTRNVLVRLVHPHRRRGDPTDGTGDNPTHNSTKIQTTRTHKISQTKPTKQQIIKSSISKVLKPIVKS